MVWTRLLEGEEGMSAQERQGGWGGITGGKGWPRKKEETRFRGTLDSTLLTWFHLTHGGELALYMDFAGTAV